MRKMELLEPSGRAIAIGLMIMFSLILMFGTVSAIELNPFAKIKETVDYGSKYPSIEIYNTILWVKSSKIADYKLNYNSEQCLVNCESYGETNLYVDGKLFDSVEFKGKNNNLAVSYQYYIEQPESYDVKIPVYDKQCKIELNKTSGKDEEVCTSKFKEDKTEIKTRQIWKPYNFETLPAGNYKWKLIANKKPTQSLDWIATGQGIELSEYAWWNSSWAYKKQIKIQESTGNNWNNYSVYLNITFNANMKNDFSDLRFLDSSETSELKYYIESKTDSNSAQVWVKTNLAGNVNTTVYMYYGNSLASTTSNRTTAFLWEDDGLKDRTGEYTLTGTATTWSWSAGVYTFQAGASTTAIASPTGFSASNYSITAQMRDVAGAFYVTGIAMRAGGSNSAYKIQKVNGNIDARIDDASQGIVGTATNNAYFNATIWAFGSTINWTGVGDTSASFQKTDTTYSSGYGGFWSYTDGASNFKTLRIRAYGNPEPSATFGTETVVEDVAVVLKAPADSYLSNSGVITFNATVNTLGANVSNMSLWTNESGTFTIVNYTIGLTGNISNQVWTRSLSNGSYLWNVQGCNINGLCNFASSNRTFTIDTVAPTVAVAFPTGYINQGYVGSNISLNYTVSADAQACWFSYNSTNTTTPCQVNASFIADISKTLTLYANDSFGNVGRGTTSWNYNLFQNSISYNATTSSSAQESFAINVSYGLAATSATGVLVYNGTRYNSTASLLMGGTITFTNQLAIPIISGSQTKSFYFEMTFANSTNTYNFNSSTYNQTIAEIGSIQVTSGSCAAGYSGSLYFAGSVETNLTMQNIDVSYNYRYGIANTSAITTYGNLTNVAGFWLCINNTSPVYNMGYGEVQYSSNGFVARRFYLFTSSRLTNVTANNTLFELENSLATSFLLTVTDTNLVPLVGDYVTLLRWYPNLNQYKIVEMGKLDDKGQTVLNVKTQDVDYRIGVYDVYGNLIKLINPVRMVCLVSPCSYSITVNTGTRDYSSFLNIQNNLSFNPTSKIFTYIWNDPAQVTTMMNLTVFKDTGTDTTIVCSNSATGFTGVITCDVSGQTGVLRAVVYRSASPPVEIVQMIVSIAIGTAILTIAGGSTLILFLSFLLAVPLFLIGAYVSPILGIVLSFVALIPALMFGGISIVVIIAFAAMGGIIWHFMKKT